MKSVRPVIATAAIAFAGHAWAAAPVCAGPTPGPEFAAPAHPTYPSFCSIPQAPKDVRAAQVFRAQVVTTRLAGATVTRDTAAETWSLGGTDDFAKTARREAQPPPPPTASGATATADFLAEAKAKAAPPPKPEHRH